MSLIVREPPPLLSLIAGVAVCEAAGEQAAVRSDLAAVKWPNDIVLAAPAADRATADGWPGAPAPSLPKLGGILVEGRPQEGWAVVGVGLNVAVDVGELPPDVRTRAASLGLDPTAIEPLLAAILGALEKRLAQPVEETLDAWRKRDALRGRRVSWTQGAGLGVDVGEGSEVAQGVAEGIDGEGHLLVRRTDGTLATLSAGEVHLAVSDHDLRR